MLLIVVMSIQASLKHVLCELTFKGTYVSKEVRSTGDKMAKIYYCLACELTGRQIIV